MAPIRRTGTQAVTNGTMLRQVKPVWPLAAQGPGNWSAPESRFRTDCPTRGRRGHRGRQRQSPQQAGGAVDLWADARAGGYQRAVAQSGRPVRAHLRRKRVATGRIHRQGIGPGNPLHIRAKLGLATETQCQVGAQSCGFGHRLDQAAERCLARQREIVTLGEVGSGYVPASIPPMRHAGAGSPAALTTVRAAALRRLLILLI